MKINQKKTQLLCISGRNDSTVNTYVRATTGDIIKSSDTLKILGFTFGTDPTPEAHIKKVEESFRKKIWTLRYLKKAKLDNSDIRDVYCSVIRAGIDYCGPTYHSMLTQGISDRLENLQCRALK